MTKRLWYAVLWCLGLLFMVSEPAGADPAGPTNYQTRVDAVEPSAQAFEFEIIGGDSFVLLRRLGTESVIVSGYGGEPYLRFDPDDTVWENRNSPAKYLNISRYTDRVPDMPDSASPDAEPDWHRIRSGNSYAWHDHRSHWMMPDPPLGLGPGDQVMEGIIPVWVDGQEHRVVVKSDWMPAPSPVPSVIGVLLGLGGLALSWGRRKWLTIVMGTAAIGAAVIGISEYFSVPPETQPSFALWALPTIAIIAASASRVLLAQPQNSLPLLFGGSVAIMVFAILRVEGLYRAILPTALPFWVDRLITAASGTVAIGAVVLSAVALGRLLSPNKTVASRS